jgi:hypothetical protein
MELLLLPPTPTGHILSSLGFIFKKKGRERTYATKKCILEFIQDMVQCTNVPGGIQNKEKEEVRSKACRDA